MNTHVPWPDYFARMFPPESMLGECDWDGESMDPFGDQPFWCRDRAVVHDLEMGGEFCLYHYMLRHGGRIH